MKIGKTAQSSRRNLQESPNKTLGDSMAVRQVEGEEDGGVDKDALAFIRAKKHVQDIHKAKRK